MRCWRKALYALCARFRLACRFCFSCCSFTLLPCVSEGCHCCTSQSIGLGEIRNRSLPFKSGCSFGGKEAHKERRALSSAVVRIGGVCEERKAEWGGEGRGEARGEARGEGERVCVLCGRGRGAFEREGEAFENEEATLDRDTDASGRERDASGRERDASGRERDALEKERVELGTNAKNSRRLRSTNDCGSLLPFTLNPFHTLFSGSTPDAPLPVCLPPPIPEFDYTSLRISPCQITHSRGSDSGPSTPLVLYMPNLSATIQCKREQTEKWVRSLLQHGSPWQDP